MAKPTINQLWDRIDEMLDDIIKHREWLENIAEMLQELTDRVEELEKAVDDAGLNY